ncbi:MAG: hypothetical protein H6712_20635 [Myxococcales bacterium]|nr:hypothetical protein [Myxococcales bacterium]MCB9716285.1 hypothetical protein [Myxococcales bacterium]
MGTFATAVLLTMACGPAPTTGAGGESEDDSGTGSSTGSDGATTNTSMTMTSAGSVGATGSTGMDESTDDGATTTAPGTDGSSTGDGGSSSSGEPPGPAYPPCMDAAECPEPYDVCWPPFGGGNYCSIECMDASECPAPTSGDAVPVCEGPPMQPQGCVLDCSEGMCPDGMDCVDIFGNGAFLRCTYP